MTKSEALLKHAQKHGTDSIAETAVDLGFDLPELTELLIKLDAVDQARKPRIAQRHKRIDLHTLCETRAKKMLGLVDEQPEAA